MTKGPHLLPSLTRPPALGALWTPFPLAHPPEGEQDKTQAPAKPQEEPPYPYDKVPPAWRGRPALPAAPHHLLIQSSQQWPRVSPFSGLDNVLQSEGTADLLSCPFTTGPPCTFREMPGPWAYPVQGTGGAGLAWPGAVPLCTRGCRSLHTGRRQAGDDPRLGHRSHSGGAKSQLAHG